ncbi:hypothetical protein CcI6DRAFT_01834 [Frankia sp. CcI6]|nr:hypothetical protein CcI6DRAFT_01834 [Frankia sp. CcI6]KFB07000.1 hypothetical protein ALLO2DRAFT_00289 [Frankia sp. Allo2]OAA30591.1 hypothetical protein AAY23_1007161 [Frankia casuarinae]
MWGADDGVGCAGIAPLTAPNGASLTVPKDGVPAGAGDTSVGLVAAFVIEGWGGGAGS